MKKRCPGCGTFLVDGACPNIETLPHTEYPEPVSIVQDVGIVQEAPAPLPTRRTPETKHRVGSVVAYDWSGQTVQCLVTSNPDMDGVIGLMVLSPNVRVYQDTLERIPDG